MRKSYEYEKEQKDLKSRLTGILSQEDVEKLVAMDFSAKAVKNRKKSRGIDYVYFLAMFFIRFGPYQSQKPVTENRRSATPIMLV